MSIQIKLLNYDSVNIAQRKSFLLGLFVRNNSISCNMFCCTLNYRKLNVIFRGVFRNLSRGGLNFFSLSRGGGSAPVGAWKPPEINRFHWSREGGLAPIAPPEYASGNIEIFMNVFHHNISNWRDIKKTKMFWISKM